VSFANHHRRRIDWFDHGNVCTIIWQQRFHNLDYFPSKIRGIHILKPALEIAIGQWPINCQMHQLAGWIYAENFNSLENLVIKDSWIWVVFVFCYVFNWYSTQRRMHSSLVFHTLSIITVYLIIFVTISTPIKKKKKNIFTSRWRFSSNDSALIKKNQSNWIIFAFRRRTAYYKVKVTGSFLHSVGAFHPTTLHSKKSESPDHFRIPSALLIKRLCIPKSQSQWII
jgi:hypothetical protein